MKNSLDLQDAWEIVEKCDKESQVKLLYRESMDIFWKIDKKTLYHHLCK